MKTYSAKPEDIKRGWFVVDAEGKTLGRLASRIALHLRGKHKPMYTPHMDTGDFIVVVNAEKVQLTGRKWDQKMYYRHTGQVGGLKSTSAKKMRETHPERIMTFAVRGMLPKNPLGRRMLKKLKVYTGPDHPHQAQQPKPLKFD